MNIAQHAPLSRQPFRPLDAIKHLLVAAAIVSAPSLIFGMPLWKIPHGKLLVVAIFAASYLVAAAGIGAWIRRGIRFPAVHAALVALAAFGFAFTFFTFVLWRQTLVFWDFPRLFLFMAAALGSAALIGFAGPRLLRGATLACVSVALLVGLGGQFCYAIGWLPRPKPGWVETHALGTSLYYLQLGFSNGYIDHPEVHGGALARLPDGALLATGDGRMFHITQPDNGPLQTRRLAISVPINSEEFRVEAPRVFAGKTNTHVESEWFRVTDILVQPRGDSLRIFAAHHHWDSSKQCTVLRVSVLDASLEEILSENSNARWRSFYDTDPCLTLNTTGPRGSRFAGLEVGGRMALQGNDSMLLSVGGQEFDGWNRQPDMSQDPGNSYGKIMLLHLNDGSAEVYSLGLRNSQGLFIDESGMVWATDQGPQGGDEINVIRRDANYGWARVTYGTEYAQMRWPANPSPGRHDGFEQPLYAFVPSQGISDIIHVRGDLFPYWKNDLIVATLRGKKLWRVRVEQGRVILTEPIEIGRRIRDVLEDDRGRLLLWTDEGDIVRVQPADSGAGDTLILQCQGCHALKSWEPSAGLGPNLHSVVGRPVAARADFNYSEAMRASGGTWSEERLERFLENPAAALPGTTMQFPGIPDAEQRKTLVEYLKRQ